MMIRVNFNSLLVFPCFLSGIRYFIEIGEII